jgi:lactate permease
MQAPPLNLLAWLLAFSPIAIVLILMVGFRWGGSKAGPVGWIVAMIVAWLFFGAGFEVLVYSQLQGVLLTLYVLYIIWMALVLYRVVDEAGAIIVIGHGIARLTSEPTMQLLLLAWAFSAFLQGVAGFGVPIAVVAPLLIGLGFAPVTAVAAVAIGHSWSVTFGDMASSFQALIAATDIPGEALAPWSSFFLGVACFGCGLAATWTCERWQSIRRGWPALLLMGTVMAGVQAGLAVSGLWNLAGFAAGLAGLAVGALVARLPRYHETSNDGPRGFYHPRSEEADQDRPSMSLGLALAPYLVLIGVVAASELWPWLHTTLNQVKVQVEFPELRTSYGWTTPAGPGRTISIFGHAGALLLYVSLAFLAIYWLTGHYTPGVAGRVVKKTIRSAVPSSIGILSMVGFAVVMGNSGMTYILALGLGKAAGPLYPFVSPFIGLLGAFMTGSNTNSNVVFAPLQQQAAELLGMNELVILGAQTTGGALGSMIAPAKLIVGASTAGLAGKEGRVLKRTLLPGLLITAVIGVLALLAIYLGEM